MSSKEKFIQNIRTARTQQLKWLNQVKLMVSGVMHQKDAIPVNQTDSEFSRWLYNEAMIFSTSNAKGVVDEMVDLHTQCYDIYLNIYGILFGAEKGGFMGMFGSKKASRNDLMLAQNNYNQLVQLSDQLLGRIRAFESMMLATAETKFDEMIFEQIDAPAATETEDTHSDSKQKIYFRGQLIEG
jgi:hypothetical protein